MGVVAERLAIDIVANAGNAIAEFKKVGVAARGLEGSAASGGKGLGRLGQAGAAAGNMLKANMAGGVAAAGAALVAFGASSVNATRDLDRAIRDVQRIAGGTAEEASKLVAILDDFEVPVEVLNKGFFRLSREIGRNDAAFAKSGFSVAKNAKGNVDLSATLLNIADAYKATEDPAKRATLLTAAFGRGGAELIPILEQGRAGIEKVFGEAGKLGQVRTQEQIDASEKLRLALDDLNDSANEMKLAMGTALVPFLTDTANAITKAMELGKQITTLGGLVKNKPRAEGGVGGWLDAVFGPDDPEKLDEVAGGLGSLGTDLTDLGALFRPFAEDTEEADKALDSLSKTLFATADADRALAAADRDVTSAHDALNKLMKAGAVDEEKVADSRRSLADATRSLADANRGVAKAQKDYDQAVDRAAALGGWDSALDLVAEAGENLADAQDTQASASDRAKEAAEDLRDAQAGDPEFQQKLADARQKVADATFDMSQKSLASVTAHEEETTALSLHADQVQRLFDLNKGLITQHPDLLRALAPTQSALAGAGATGGVFGQAGGPHVTEVPLSSSATTTNNVTINTTGTVDPSQLARQMIWELN